MRPGSAFLFLFIAFSAAVADEPKAKEDVKTFYDVVYTNAGGTELKLDVARPASGAGPFPAVLAIHGGGWQHGNKNDMRPVLLQLAREGFVAVSPQYRLAPKERFPAQVYDVKAAVRWVKGHAKEYDLDPEHVGAVGFSAGGHLAMMLGVTGPDDGLDGDAPPEAASSRIQAVVNYFGPTELGAADIPEFSRNLVNEFLGGTAQEKPDAYAQASPLTFVSKGDAPILSFQGTKDPLVPYSQAVKLADAQTKAGVPGRVELLLGLGHGWGGDDLKQTADETFAFFKKHLRP
jgi:acetyl esterase/lipase